MLQLYFHKTFHILPLVFCPISPVTHHNPFLRCILILTSFLLPNLTVSLSMLDCFQLCFLPFPGLSPLSPPHAHTFPLPQTSLTSFSYFWWHLSQLGCSLLSLFCVSSTHILPPPLSYHHSEPHPHVSCPSSPSFLMSLKMAITCPPPPHSVLLPPILWPPNISVLLLQPLLFTESAFFLML